MIGLSSDETITSSDMPKDYEVIVLSDDDDEELVFSSRECVAQVTPQPASQPAPEAKPVPKVKPTPKAKPAKHKRVSESTLNGWRDNCACEYPQEYETCTCEPYRDFLEWEKKCTCRVMAMNWCRCTNLVTIFSPSG
jgi:hypothetical protein